MFVIKEERQSQAEIKKSKFLGFCFTIESEDKIKIILGELRKKYRDARHIVYAYRFFAGQTLREKFDNDKEPTGSAGRPLLYLLQKKEVVNCLLVVVRYFGGTKLGIGGLIRAYTQAGQRVLDNNLILYEDRR